MGTKMLRHPPCKQKAIMSKSTDKKLDQTSSLGLPNNNQKPTYVINTPLPRSKTKPQKVQSKKPVKNLTTKTNVLNLLKTTSIAKEKALKRQTRGNESDYSDSKNPKLEEICFFKNEFGKRIIAKYKTKNNQKGKLEDNLIIAWDGNNRPEVVSYKVRGPEVYALVNDFQSDQRNLFRVHDFTKWSPRCLNTKRKTVQAKKIKKKVIKTETESSDDD